MGRYSTGAITTDECRKIELSKLLKWGLIKKGSIINSNLKWTGGSNISIAIDYTDSTPILTLHYTVTDNCTGEKYPYNYDIQFCKVPSNIGKGEVLYFICPESGLPCRILYMAYSYHKWKCRQAYQNRIYYPTQVSSKKGMYNDRYWQLEHRLEDYLKGRRTNTYKGKLTKRAAKISAMIDERNRMDKLRWSAAAMPKILQKLFGGRDMWR